MRIEPEPTFTIRQLAGISDFSQFNGIQDIRGFAHASYDQFCGWIVVGAFDGPKLVSTTCICPYHRPPHSDYPTGYIGELSAVYTLPEYRKKGLHSKSLTMAIELAGQQGLDCLVSDTTDAAVHICMMHGFVTSQEHRLWYIYRKQQ